MPHMDPTLVLGVGSLPTDLLTSGQRQVATASPETQPILRYAVWPDGATPDAAALRAAIGALMGQVLDPTAVVAVQQAGCSVGTAMAGGRTPLRVLLLAELDRRHEPLVQAVLTALRGAVEDHGLTLSPVLAALGLAPPGDSDRDPDWLLAALEDAAGAGGFDLAGLGLLGAGLQSGQTIAGRDDYLAAVEAVLLTALIPVADSGAWLLAGAQSHESPLWSPGLRLLYTPRREIDAALGLALAGDVMHTLSRPEDAPPPRDEDLEPLDEHRIWISLWRQLTAETVCGDGFGVEVRSDHILRELPAMRWALWPAHLAEYDTQFGAWLATDWSARLRRSGNQAERGLQQAVDQLLDEIVRGHANPLGRVRALALAIKRKLQAWTCDRGQPVESAPDLAAERRRLEAALLALPQPSALTMRAVVGLLAIAWLTFAGVRPAAGDPLTLILGLGAAAVAAGAVIWTAAKRQQDALTAATAARDAYLTALRRKYGLVLEGQALAAMRRMKQALLDRCDALEADVDLMVQELHSGSATAQAACAACRPRSTAQLQAVVESWEHLRGAPELLWRSRDAGHLASDLLQLRHWDTWLAFRAAVLSPVGLRELALTAEDPLRGLELPPPRPDQAPPNRGLARCFAVPARELVRQLGRDQLSWPSFYLKLRLGETDAVVPWVEAFVAAASGTAHDALWRTAAGVRQRWLLTPAGDPLLSELPCEGGTARQAAPGMLGPFVVWGVARHA